MESKRSPVPAEGYRVGIGSWDESEGVEEIGASIHRELAELGHRPAFFRIHGEAPPPCDILLLHGPRGRFLPVLQQAQRQRPRPRVVIWNTEGLPDLRLPWRLMTGAGNLRRRFASIGSTAHPIGRRIGEAVWFSKLDARLMRFDFLGQYLEAIARGWVDHFFDISEVYARILSRAGIPVTAVPYGSMVGAFEEMEIERDIDVLWIGLRASRRRSRLLDRIRADLEKRGIGICVVDGEENPSVFGKERTRLFNRSKITLNLLRTWYDENSMRLCLAAANRSLIVSEPLLPHVPDWVPGLNYVAASPAGLADAIADHLSDDRERERITDEAFRLVTSTLTFGTSIQTIMRQVGEGVSHGGEGYRMEPRKRHYRRCLNPAINGRGPKGGTFHFMHDETTRMQAARRRNDGGPSGWRRCQRILKTIGLSACLFFIGQARATAADFIVSIEADGYVAFDLTLSQTITNATQLTPTGGGDDYCVGAWFDASRRLAMACSFPVDAPTDLWRFSASGDVALTRCVLDETAPNCANVRLRPASPFCGNGVLNAGEQCDDGLDNGTGASCCSVGCERKPNGSTSCDGNDCTRTDTCFNGLCIAGACADGQPCSFCGGTCVASGSSCECEP